MPGTDSSLYLTSLKDGLKAVLEWKLETRWAHIYYNVYI